MAGPTVGSVRVGRADRGEGEPCGAGTLAFFQKDRDPSLRFNTESLAIAREHRNLQLEADALIGLARVSLLDGNALVMQQHAQASLEAARAAGDEQRVGAAAEQLAEATRLEGNAAATSDLGTEGAVPEAPDETESPPPA